MGETTIQWTDTTWNPVRGCAAVSPGCENCYAQRTAHRFNGPGQPYEGLTRPTAHGPKWTGQIRLVPEKLDEPLRWRKPRRVFVNSMSDLFHEDVPDEFIDKVFAVMACSRRHTYQVLTKRPDRMRAYLTGYAAGGRHIWPAAQAIEVPGGVKDPTGWPLPNLWLGVSVDDQDAADERIPLLLETPAAVRFLSCEPLLEQVLFPPAWLSDEHRSLDWVIVGGESGPGARPCHVSWVRSIVEQCRDEQVPVFVKQLGADSRCDVIEAGSQWSQGDVNRLILHDRAGGDMAEWPEDLRIREFPA